MSQPPQHPQRFPPPQGSPRGAASGQQQGPGHAPQPSGHTPQGSAFPPGGPPDQAAPVKPAPISPEAQRDVEPRTPRFRRFDLPVTTQPDLPGAGALESVGIVLGVVTRPRDLAHSPEMSYILTEARQDAIAAMVLQAQQVGADGVVGLRFDGGAVSGSVAEITAYGTAVRQRA